MKIDPSTMRGIEFATLMNGENRSDRNRLRPSAMPNTTPSADADEEAVHRLLQGDHDLLGERSLRRPVCHPGLELPPDAGWAGPRRTGRCAWC